MLKSVNYECSGRTILHEILGEHLTINTVNVTTLHLIAMHKYFTRLNSLDVSGNKVK